MAFIGNTNTTQAFTPAIDYFSGTGSATAFTLSRPVASVAQVQVTIDNVAQNPSTAFTVSSNTITFTSAPLSGTNNIYVYYTSPITQVIAPGQGTVTATSMASSTGTGAGVFQTSPTITTPTIDTITSAASTALTLKSAGTTAITVNASQQVGIGTTSPASPLQINTAGVNTTVQINSTDASGGYGANLSLNNTGTGGRQYVIYSTSNADGDVGGGKLKFTDATAGVTRMFIDSSGKTIIGATTAVGSARLVVSSDPSTGVDPMIVSNTRSAAATDYQIICYRNGSIVGSVQTTLSSTIYATSSDYRLKEDIQPMSGALSKVLQLKPVTYKWKLDSTESQGFIAHELQEVVPEAVCGQKDELDADGNPKYQGIDTSFLVATLTAALQETKTLIDTQAETINALTARIVALENR